ncbi:MAG TPA: sulfatase-like hydrolase/transferase [Gaiellaceae bacterium]|nr:sulfatase-like hydrolase/transferase [Gaiellaceae bacterium]
MRGVVGAGLHVAALWGLAVAQPLFDLLGGNAEFFAVRDSTRWDVAVFAVALVLLPPAAVTALVALAGLVAARPARALHLSVVAALVALLALQAGARTTGLGSTVLLPASAVVGAAAAFAYARLRPVRSLAGALAPAPLLFLGLFLFASPAGDLVLTRDPEPRTVAVASRTPVVLLVFDEISTVSLLDERGEIDARRYPSFAALAADSTWFRNAATVDAWTTNAVPAILTGRYPRRGRLPVFAEHPDNLFTLLGARHRLNVSESLTRLCPRSLCPRKPIRPLVPRLEELVADSGLVYLHLALPADLRARLPSVSGTWGAFLETSHERTRRRLALHEEFVSGLDGEGASLNFAHFMFPHLPWEFLPSGRRYEPADLPGFETTSWGDDRFLVEQAYQRYLLQLGFADRLLGDLLARLEASGLYERALVVVAADHGVSFRPGGRRRAFVDANLEDVAFVPLLVKRPGQRGSAVDDAPVQTVDILPTIADALGVRVPWRLDGTPLFGAPRRGRYVFFGDRGRFERAPGALVARREASLRRQLALFGEGDATPGLYGIGPNPALLGRRVESLAARTGDARAELDQAAALAAVDLAAPVIPARLTGRIVGGGAPSRDLAVALNGRVAAVASSYAAGGEERFSVLVPESSLRQGANDVELFWVRSPRDLVRLQ